MIESKSLTSKTFGSRKTTAPFLPFSLVVQFEEGLLSFRVITKSSRIVLFAFQVEKS